MEFRKFTHTAAGAIFILLLTVPAVAADLTPQQVGRVDPASVANGYRASKIIGANVVNDRNEKIGTVDDLLVGERDRVPYAVLSVGGFLGVGSKLVVVPYADLRMSDTNVVFPGASKEALKTMLDFKYASR